MGGVTTSGAKRQVGAKQPGGNVLGAKRLGEEMVWGQNIPNSRLLPNLGHLSKHEAFQFSKEKSSICIDEMQP